MDPYDVSNYVATAQRLADALNKCEGADGLATDEGKELARRVFLVYGRVNLLRNHPQLSEDALLTRMQKGIEPPMAYQESVRVVPAMDEKLVTGHTMLGQFLYMRDERTFCGRVVSSDDTKVAERLQKQFAPAVLSPEQVGHFNSFVECLKSLNLSAYTPPAADFDSDRYNAFCAVAAKTKPIALAL